MNEVDPSWGGAISGPKRGNFVNLNTFLLKNHSCPIDLGTFVQI
jgi:hypothetical protein